MSVQAAPITPTAFETIFHLLPDAVFVGTPDRRITACNAAAAKLFGWPQVELIGQPTRVIYVSDADYEQQARRYNPHATGGDDLYEARYCRRDGSIFWAETQRQSIHDIQGAIIGFVGIFRDVTARRRWDARRDLLVRMGSELPTTADPLARLDIAARIATQHFADGCNIYLREDDGTIRLAVARHIDATKEALFHTHFGRYALPPDSPTGYPHVMRTGESELLPQIDDAILVRAAYDAEHLALMRVIAVRSAITVPLVAEGRVLGAITLWITSPDRTFDRDDLVIAEELGHRVAVAFAEMQTKLRLAELAAQLQREKDALAASERRARESEAKYRQIVETAQEGIWIIDNTARTTYVNARMAEMLGYTPGEILGQRIDAFTDEEGRRQAEQSAERWQNGIAEQHDFRFKRKDGSELWTLIAASPLTDGEGNIVGTLEMIADITERKREEQRAALLGRIGVALASSFDVQKIPAEVAELLVPAFADGCALYELTMGRLEVRLVEHRDELASALLRDLEAPIEVERLGEPLLIADVANAALAPGRAAVEHTELLALLGARSLMVLPICVHGRAWGALALIAGGSRSRFDERDLAFADEVGRRLGVALDNAHLFAAAQRERIRAEEAGRAKDEFLAVVSHELRTPLQAIVGWARMLRTGSLDDGMRERALETIDRNAKVQTQLIEDILDVSRIITGKLRLSVGPVNLPEVVQAAVDAIRPAAEAKNVRLLLVADPAIGPCTGDAGRLQQVVWNLVANAVKFTPKGGRVQVHLAPVDSSLEIVVEDSGQGIPPEFLPHIFERFRQADSGTRRAHGGLGLGLSIVKHIVELHGGTVRASSPGPGQGSIFVVTLPVALIHSHPDRRAAAPLPATGELPSEIPVQLRGLKALVLDDEPDTRDLLQSVLRAAGMEVAIAESVSEALLLVRKMHPDVVISDIGMPGEDGYDFIRRFRMLSSEEGGGIPAVAITAYARTEDRTRALLAGFSMHLSKPIEPAELFAVLVSVTGRPR